MILTCPNCDTRYSVDGAKFPAAGRTVRCAKCGHSWHQAAEAPEPEQDPLAEAVIPEPAPEPEPVSPYPVNNPSSIRAYAPAAAVAEPRGPLGPRLAVVAGWGLAGLLVAVRTFRWTPRGE